MEQYVISDTANTAQPSTQHQQPATTTNSSETSMVKLTEVFMTAALAFKRLGELTQNIHVAGETKWTEGDAAKLSNALEKFQEECADITKSLQTRTGKMIRTDFKRRTINQCQGNVTAAQPLSASASAAATPSRYATLPSSHYNGAASRPSGSQSIQRYSYLTQRTIPTYPIHQKFGLPSTSYSVGQKRPAQALPGVPVKRIVGGTTFRPYSSSSVISQPTSSNVYRK